MNDPHYIPILVCTCGFLAGFERAEVVPHDPAEEYFYQCEKCSQHLKVVVTRAETQEDP